MQLPSKGFAYWLSLAPFLLLPYDSLTYLLGLDAASTSQTFPMTAFLSPFYLMFRVLSGLQIDFKDLRNRLPIYIYISLCTITLFSIALESAFSSNAEVQFRSHSALRQSISMLLGICSYFMFVDAVSRSSIKQISNTILWGGLPSLILILIQFLSGSDRTQGFSSEPSHLGDFLVWAMLPACFASSLSKRIRYTFLMVCLVALISTVSSTSYFKAFGVLLVYFLVNGYIYKSVFLLPILLLAGYYFLTLVPDNYASIMILGMYEAFQNGSAAYTSYVDRFYGFYGPIAHLFSEPRALLGYGFGGDSVYFYRIFDNDIAENIMLSKTDLPSISSLQGKMLMYGGVLGYALYSFFWLYCWKHAVRSNQANFMIPALFLGSLFSLGPFFLPYVWLWLAIASKPKPPVPCRTLT